jgi:hypothetical protein
MKQMYASRLRTPDGTILQSFHRHDYKEHVDAVSGETYMIDGGIDYIRSSVNTAQPEWMIVYTDDPFEVKREVPVWGTYGKSGKEDFRWISVADMEDDHIKALLDPAMYVRKSIKDVLKEEAKNRGLM